MDFRLKYDMHTHSVYSCGIFGNHAKGTIMQNAERANALGLEYIGISDHGPGHFLYGLDMKKLPQIKEDIKKAKAAFPGLNVKLSVEANIADAAGKLDICTDDFKLFDYVIAGFHYGVSGSLRCFNNLRHNTDMVVAALYENDIKLLTHPGDKVPFDIDEISKACEATHTLMEINNKHNGLTAEGIKIASKYDVDFVISSDAHSPQCVGSFENALERIKEARLPFERVVNLWTS